jgi:hypothetical protein
MASNWRRRSPFERRLEVGLGVAVSEEEFMQRGKRECWRAG